MPELPLKIWTMVCREVYVEGTMQDFQRIWTRNCIADNLSNLRRIRVVNSQLRLAADSFLFQILGHRDTARMTEWLTECGDIAFSPYAKNVQEIVIPLGGLALRRHTKLTEHDAVSVIEILKKLHGLREIHFKGREWYGQDEEEGSNSLEVITRSHRLASGIIRSYQGLQQLRVLSLPFVPPFDKTEEAAAFGRELMRLEQFEMVWSEMNCDSPESSMITLSNMLAGMKSLTKLEVGCNEECGLVCPLQVLPTTKLRTLALQDMCLESHILVKTLTANPHLESFTVELASLTTGTWGTVFAALQKCEHLHSLELNVLFYPTDREGLFSYFYPWDPDDDDDTLDQFSESDKAVFSSRWEDYHAFGDLMRYVRDKGGFEGNEWWATSRCARELCSLAEAREDPTKLGKWLDK